MAWFREVICGVLPENGDGFRRAVELSGAVRNVAGSALPENGDFDVDSRELQGQAGVDILCGFLTDIGRELGKPVLMTQEGGSPAHPVLGFDPEHYRVVLLAEPR
ncbi:hypothetical protein ACIA2T_12920 [Amycolatopsis japonica]|uniref:hypothetical protein n=1 Tax=Amycolatopsis japonica TaxID=208439 RepID=UPI00378F407F